MENTASLSGNKEIIIGNCISLRDNAKLANTIVFFTNLVLTRTKVPEENTFATTLHNVTNDFLTCLDHKSYPLENILKDKDILLSHVSTLFLDYLNLSNEERQEQNNNENHQEGYSAIFDLSCFLHEYNNVVLFQCVYSKDLFKPDTIVTFFNLHVNILQKAIVNPEAKVEELLADFSYDFN